MGIELICIIASSLAALIAFFLGWYLSIHPDKVSNEAELGYKKELEIEIKTNQEKINTLKAEQKRLDDQYHQTQKHILDIEQDAKKIYDLKVEQLEKEYNQTIEKLSKSKEEIQNEYADELDKMRDELESLRATKAAAIEAARKEEMINKNQEDYCLRIPVEEQNDVSILKSVRNRITKPRAVSMVIWNSYYQPLAKKLFPKILGADNVTGIYKITNQKTGECYIGQSIDCRKRWNEHCKCGLSIDTPPGNKLYAAMQEYGLENFSFELLERCSADKLNEKERYFISLYSADSLGYNSNKGIK